jgi:hypothetical protein
MLQGFCRTHAQGVKNSDALRAAMDQIDPVQVALWTRIGQSSPLYKAFAAIRNSTTGLTEAQERALDGAIINAQQSGANLQVACPGPDFAPVALCDKCLHSLGGEKGALVRGRFCASAL